MRNLRRMFPAALLADLFFSADIFLAHFLTGGLDPLFDGARRRGDFFGVGRRRRRFDDGDRLARGALDMALRRAALGVAAARGAGAGSRRRLAFHGLGDSGLRDDSLGDDSRLGDRSLGDSRLVAADLVAADLATMALVAAALATALLPTALLATIVSAPAALVVLPLRVAADFDAPERAALAWAAVGGGARPGGRGLARGRSAVVFPAAAAALDLALADLALLDFGLLDLALVAAAAVFFVLVVVALAAFLAGVSAEAAVRAVLVPASLAPRRAPATDALRFFAVFLLDEGIRGYSFYCPAVETGREAS